MAERTCSIDECDRPLYGRGWCHMHYARVLNTGSAHLRCRRCEQDVPHSRPDRFCSDECRDKRCSVEGCDRAYYSLNLCRIHWRRNHRGGTTDLRVTRRPEGPPPEGQSWCAGCNEFKDEGDFPPDSRRTGGLGYWCRPCDVVKKQEAHERKLRDDPDYRRRRVITRMYNITWDEYLQMMAAGCRICGGVAEAVDHDHACCPDKNSCGKCVRGALCGRCNRGLGYFQDQPELLRSAADYLDEWEARRERRMEVPRLPAPR